MADITNPTVEELNEQLETLLSKAELTGRRIQEVNTTTSAAIEKKEASINESLTQAEAHMKELDAIEIETDDSLNLLMMQFAESLES